MSPGIAIASQIALQAALIVLFLGSLFTLAFGVSLMLGNRWVFALNEKTKRWISTREALRPMDLQRSIEGWLHLWHVPVGIGLALCSAFVAYVGMFHYDVKAVAHAFQAHPSVWEEMLIQAGWWFAMIGALAGLVVGVLLTAKPALLQSAEGWANRAYSGRRATKPLEVMHFAPDHCITASPRWSGALISAGSLYIAVVLGQFLIQRL